MRRAAKTDANQTAIVQALRDAGCSVQSLAAIGKGCPDLLVCGPDGVLHLIEVKDGDKPPSARKLTPDQVSWHATWTGRVHVVTSVWEALAIVGCMAQDSM